MADPANPWRSVPRWQAAVALLAIGLIYLALPQQVRVGPSWLVLVVVVIVSVPIFVTHLRGRHRLSHGFGRALTVLVALAVGVSAIFLLTRLPGGKIPGSDLLREAALIWVANILAFAVIYWEIDGGGPGWRRRGSYASRDFIFPQFQQDPSVASRTWMPDFIDYLFLAFNTSTAFSPTDTLVISRRAKALMMAQSLQSLIVIGVLAARAINTL